MALYRNPIETLVYPFKESPKLYGVQGVFCVEPWLGRHGDSRSRILEALAGLGLSGGGFAQRA